MTGPRYGYASGELFDLLPTRTAIVLCNAGLETVAKVAAKTHDELLRTKNFGRVMLRQVEDMLDLRAKFRGSVDVERVDAGIRITIRTDPKTVRASLTIDREGAKALGAALLAAVDQSNEDAP